MDFGIGSMIRQLHPLPSLGDGGRRSVWSPSSPSLPLCSSSSRVMKRKGFVVQAFKVPHHAMLRTQEVVSGHLRGWLERGSVSESTDLALSFIPVGLAALLCYSQKLELWRGIRSASLRSTAQLILLGFGLNFVFDGENIALSILAVVIMVLVAAYTAGERAKKMPKSHLVAFLSLAVGTAGTLVLMVLLKAFPLTPRFIVPTAGYVIGNSMSMVGNILNRLHHDIYIHRGQVEASLALGASPKQAVRSYVRRAVAQGMGPWIDSIKTAGLITLPGSMTGMLMGGSSPLEAILMQIQVLYMLLGASAISSAVSCYLGWHMLFSDSHQLLVETT